MNIDINSLILISVLFSGISHSKTRLWITTTTIMMEIKHYLVHSCNQPYLAF